MVKKKELRLRLEEVLKEKKITKYGFAKLLEKSTSNIAIYFRKDYKPNLSTLEKWAEALDCKVADFLDE